eukprot:6072322-Pleurochrysis_carterae.AAC.1
MESRSKINQIARGMRRAPRSARLSQQREFLAPELAVEGVALRRKRGRRRANYSAGRRDERTTGGRERERGACQRRSGGEGEGRGTKGASRREQGRREAARAKRMERRQIEGDCNEKKEQHAKRREGPVEQAKRKREGTRRRKQLREVLRQDEKVGAKTVCHDCNEVLRKSGVRSIAEAKFGSEARHADCNESSDESGCTGGEQQSERERERTRVRGALQTQAQVRAGGSMGITGQPEVARKGCDRGSFSTNKSRNDDVNEEQCCKKLNNTKNG